ncbi:chemotaxis protein CheA [Desulfovibrio aminophilus]|uniref:chemotaxis protein CheA n=1 Tax=Desulfovibrio aminophilus TaxID=81425 RepID=UPI000423C05F|nr:chemotaxis protein CheA [Desulfovibrio aminophilus]
MSDDLNRQVFREEAYDLLGELETTLLELEQTPGDLDVINRVFRALHTIKGSGSMFGFEDIAAFTHEVETVFDQVRNEELAVTTELLNLVFRARDYIQKMLDADGATVAPEVRQEILEGLVRVSAAAAEPAAVVEAAPGAEAGGPAEAEVAPEECGYAVRIRFRDSRPPAGFSLEPLLEELGKLGSCGVSPEKVLDPEKSGPVWNVTLRTTASEENIRDVFFFSEFDLDVEVRRQDDAAQAAPPVEQLEEAKARPDKKLGEILVEEGAIDPSDLAEALAQQKPLGQILVESGKVDKDRVEQAAAKQAQARREVGEKRGEEAGKGHPESVSSIRVAAEKLDNLVDLVGELVIVQAQISQVVGERSDPVLTALSEELERLSDALRDSTLGIRMLPIGTTFSRYRRLVRDLSADFGKDIALVTQGAETELDKTVIERLGDPLMHLLRNSIDHGIEPPEERQAAGKPSQGTILLAAEHSGGEVLIRISDDGRGMDSEAIRAKAVERGLIQPEAELSEKELFKLIFEPGFSTAKKLTSVSGRGVGMDVVKRSIDALRGSVEIRSRKGQGSEIIIRLPLTLAIIDGLQVRVGDAFFVIPLSLVEECVELAHQDVEEAGNQRILYLRGEIVPYIHLREWFEVDGAPPAIEQIVITRVEGSRMGIVVDSVIGEHQTVIKTLGRVYKDVEGISGATIKGDGSIALIIDVPRLVRGVVVASQ